MENLPLFQASPLMQTHGKIPLSCSVHTNMCQKLSRHLKMCSHLYGWWQNENFGTDGLLIVLDMCNEKLQGLKKSGATCH